MALQLAPPYPVFTDKNGDPLDNGYLYFGEVNKNPETNPIQVYYDSAFTQPAAQPLRTSNGYIVRNGSPARLYTSQEDFSLTVRDKSNVLVFTVSDATSLSNFAAQLAAGSGSSLVGYNQGGSGAVDRTVQSRLRDYVSVKDFGAVGDGVTDDTTAFTNAWAAADPQAVFVPKGSYAISGALAGQFFSTGGVTIVGGSIDLSLDMDASGNLEGLVTPAGEASQLALSSALRPTAGINRGRVNYFSGDAVEVLVPPEIVMGGFRFMGQYKKARAPVFASGVSFRAIGSMATGLGAETSRTNNNWYAVFACANDGDAAVSYKLMPFIRVGSVAGSVCTLNYAGENSHTITPITYTWANDALAGADCLVISEGGSAANNRFSGRLTTVTANTGTTVTLDTIGSVGDYDYLLVAPPNFDHYCYLGSFYSDVAGAPYNIADSGVTVESYMSSNQDPNWVASGAVAGPPGNKINWGGYVCPLAGGVIMRSVLSTSTSSGGDIYTNFSHDSSNHVIFQHSYYKAGEATSSSQIAYALINFSTGQSMYFWTSGSLEAQRTAAQIRAMGWIEP